MKLTTKALPTSDAFKANRAAHEDMIATVRAAAELAAAGGGEKSRDRHLSRGKMLPRERVANLLDPGSAFLEIGATAAHGMYGGAAPCSGVIAGIGQNPDPAGLPPALWAASSRVRGDGRGISLHHPPPPVPQPHARWRSSVHGPHGWP